MAKFSKRSLDNLKGIHPSLVQVMTEAIKNTPVDFTITSGVRTDEEQQKLYAQGRTVPGDIVTYADGIINKSNHQPKPDGYGYAVDAYPYINGTVQVNNVSAMKTIAAHIRKTAERLGITVEWGGNWKMRDYPHYELFL
ncbi:MAG: M15 family metallopeptidase [Tannerellaceae bacterium]|jgi:peptidoglycan L-alanyl-D-glutamate endopeptidase CwlK|nr:M15 family metallopeptidase [Tannerellaceae bacterium]